MIAIIADLHFGARNDSVHFRKYFKKFFEEVFFPKLEEKNISEIIIAGDVLHRRKYLNFMTLNFLIWFFSEIESRKIVCHIILGNHDIVFKNTSKYSGLNMILKESEYIFLYDKPVSKKIDGKKFLMLPWICDDNYEESMKALKKSKDDFCVTHIDMVGFEYANGIHSEKGFDIKMFSKFSKTFSGHYHKRSFRNDFYYVGSPYQMTIADMSTDNGFIIFDGKEVNWVNNTFKMFYKFVYDDENETDINKILDPIREFDITDSCVTVVIKHCDKSWMYDSVIEYIEFQNTHKFDIMDMQSYLEYEQQELIDDNEEDDADRNNYTVLCDFISNAIKDKSKRNAVTSRMYEFYMDSIDSDDS